MILTRIIDELNERGYLTEKDVFDLGKTYALFSMSLPEGTLTVSLQIDESKNLLISSRLYVARDVIHHKNIDMACIAAAKANEQLGDYLGKVTVNVVMNALEYMHTSAVPITDNTNTEYLVDLLLHFARGHLSILPRIMSICATAQTRVLTMEDVLDDHPNVVVRLPPAIKLSMIPAHEQQTISAFLCQEKLSLRQIEDLFSGISLDIYPVIIRRERISIRISSGNYCRSIAEYKVDSEAPSVLREMVERSFAQYLALKAYLGYKTTKYDVFHNAGELFAEIEDVLAS